MNLTLRLGANHIVGNTIAAVSVLYNLMEIPITDDDQRRASAVSNQSWVEFPKHARLVASLASHPSAFWERVLLVMVGKCR